MCAAKGAPPPTITWALDDEPMQRDSSHRTNQYTMSDGTTVSHMNVTNPQIKDGGVYRCAARNSVGSAEYQARINVRGACLLLNIRKGFSCVGFWNWCGRVLLPVPRPLCPHVCCSFQSKGLPEEGCGTLCHQRDFAGIQIYRLTTLCWYVCVRLEGCHGRQRTLERKQRPAFLGGQEDLGGGVMSL